MTYQSRLLLYVGLLIVLLVGMMALSFKTARDVIVEGAEEHLRHVALRKEESVRDQREELLHYTEIITGDLRLQEYLYIILELGTSRESLGAYYDRQFGSLPTDCRLIMSAEGEVLLGSEYPRLVDEVSQVLQSGDTDHFYFRSVQGVFMVVMAPVVYQGQRLATTVVAKLMDQAWLNAQEGRSSDHTLFFEEDGKILWSSNTDYQGLDVDVSHGYLQTDDQYIRLHEVTLGGANPDMPNLWFGVSESRLIELLSNYQRWVFSFAIFGGLAVLLVGWLMLRNFSRPFSMLMRTTEEMINGRLPVMSRSESRTEMDQLANRFADVLDALRREQEEVKRVHQKLQETAITDSLTGLHNRRYLEEVAPGLLAQVERDERYLTAILLDLDHFKSINDEHGHLGGDAVLKHFARLLKDNSRTSDYLFRIGGEEFLILNVTEDPQASTAFARKVRELVYQSSVDYQGASIAMTVSIGVSCCHGGSGEASLGQLMRTADKALYEAKSAGRNRVVTHLSCQDGAVVVKPRRKIALVGDVTAGERQR
ncbi:GGDEF domain-containing protein [Thiogranum longum]